VTGGLEQGDVAGLAALPMEEYVRALIELRTRAAFSAQWTTVFADPATVLARFRRHPAACRHQSNRNAATGRTG